MTHDEGLVMVLKLRKTTIGGIRGQGYADCPFVDSCRLVLLEKRRGNERFEDKPAAEVDAESSTTIGERGKSTVRESRVPIELVLAPRPGSVQGWRPRTRICAIIEGVIGVRNP